MSEQNLRDIYSYHTFIFPFLWNDGGKVKRKSFEKCLDKGEDCWNLELFDTMCEQYDSERIATYRKELYDQYQYLNAPARRAVYTLKDDQNEIVRNFRYNPKLFSPDDTGARYVIKKGSEQYSLAINSLRLKLFNSGIGLLIYELENSDYRSIKEVNRINEMGRRIYCPYIYSVSVLTSSLTADSIRLEGSAFPNVEDDAAWNITAEVRGEKEMPRMKLAKVVTMLLSNGEYSVTTNKDDLNAHNLYIEPIIDDGMFVACFVKDEAFAESLGEWNGTEYRWLSDALEKQPSAEENLARKLYEFIFVDGLGTSCVNRTMLKSLLEKHVYARWAEYGTFFAITEYSMVCVTGAGGDYIVKKPFFTLYLEFAMLALAQRASLIAFDRQISYVSTSTDRKNEEAEQEMMEAFVDFQSQLLLLEVTPKRQGIELYDMLLENLYINKEKEAIDNRIQNLFDFKVYKTDKCMNIFLLFLAIFGGLGLIVELIDVILHWCRVL